jgi:hypothetical protein
MVKTTKSTKQAKNIKVEETKIEQSSENQSQEIAAKQFEQNSEIKDDLSDCDPDSEEVEVIEKKEYLKKLGIEELYDKLNEKYPEFSIKDKHRNIMLYIHKPSKPFRFTSSKTGIEYKQYLCTIIRVVISKDESIKYDKLKDDGFQYLCLWAETKNHEERYKFLSEYTSIKINYEYDRDKDGNETKFKSISQCNNRRTEAIKKYVKDHDIKVYVPDEFDDIDVSTGLSD